MVYGFTNVDNPELVITVITEGLTEVQEEKRYLSQELFWILIIIGEVYESDRVLS